MPASNSTAKAPRHAAHAAGSTGVATSAQPAPAPAPAPTAEPAVEAAAAVPAAAPAPPPTPLVSARSIVCSLIGGVLAGVPLGIGRCYDFGDGTAGSLVVSPRLALWCGGLFVLFTLLFLAFFALQARFAGAGTRLRAAHPALDRALSGKALYGALFVVILIIWIPAFLALYPGYYASDGCIQVSYLFVDGVFDQHQPIFHTLVLTGLLSLGNALFGSYNAGLTLYCIVQAIIVAASLAFACRKAASWGASAVLCIVVTLIVAASPITQAWTFATTKDILFGAALLFSFVLAIDWVHTARTGDRFPAKTVIALAVSLLFMCLLRKQGIYVVIVVAVIALIAYRRHWRAVIATFIAPAAIAWIALTLLAAGLSAVPDSAREMLSVPSQQIARTYLLERDTLTSDQLSQIEKYYDTEALSGYIAVNADPAKGALNDDAFAQDKLGYIALWASLGASHVGCYLDAFLNTTIGYVYPTSHIANRWSGLAPWNEFSLPNCTDASNQIEQNSLLPGYYDTLQQANYDFGAGNYLIILWESPAIPYFALVFALVVLLCRRRYNRILALLLPGLFWCSLLLGPVLNTRYSYPIELCVPVMLAMCLMPARAARSDASASNASHAPVRPNRLTAREMHVERGAAQPHAQH